MQLAYPAFKPAIEEQVRRANVQVHWQEGIRERGFQVMQYLVAEQPPNLQQDSESSPQDDGSADQTGETTPLPPQQEPGS